VRRALLLAGVLLLPACAPRPGNAPADFPDSRSARHDIWTALQPMARAQGIDPGFVYAIVKLESNFDPRARNGDARGLMQIKPRVWRAHTSAPYEPSVWDWRANLRVGIEILASDRQTLEKRGVFSYPLLWAAYHYGLDYVEARGFDMSRIDHPSDPISRKLWSGDLHPVDPTR
jgi:soluble lytic murein transglycosylase-like protein